MVVDATAVVVTEKSHQHEVTAGASTTTDHRQQMLLMPRMMMMMSQPMQKEEIKSLTCEEKKQFEQQFRKFILSHKYGGPRAFRKKLFRRLWVACKGAKYGFDGFHDPSPCRGFAVKPHQFGRPCQTLDGPYCGFGFGFKPQSFGGPCHGIVSLSRDFGGRSGGLGFWFQGSQFSWPPSRINWPLMVVSPVLASGSNLTNLVAFNCMVTPLVFVVFRRTAARAAKGSEVLWRS
jgi:hypothetical protein